MPQRSARLAQTNQSISVVHIETEIRRISDIRPPAYFFFAANAFRVHQSAAGRKDFVLARLFLIAYVSDERSANVSHSPSPHGRTNADNPGRKGMPRQLKTYVTTSGFFELAVAAPTMKAALDIWAPVRTSFGAVTRRRRKTPRSSRQRWRSRG